MVCPPDAPQHAALSVSIEQLASTGEDAHIMQSVSPCTTILHGESSLSHGRCTSSSACPSQQGSKPRTSNSCSPAVRVEASMLTCPHRSPGVYSAPSTPMNEPWP